MSLIVAETQRASQAYADYVAMGDGRSLSKLLAAYRAMPKNKAPTLRMQTLRAWSANHLWQSRLRQLAQDQARQAEQSEARRHETYRRAIRTKERRLADKLIARAESMLDFPLTQLVRETRDADGRTVYQTIMPGKWSLRDAAAMVETASRLYRLSAEMETEHVKTSGRIRITQIVAEIPAAVAEEYGLDDDDSEEMDGDSGAAGVPLLPMGAGDGDENGEE